MSALFFLIRLSAFGQIRKLKRGVMTKRGLLLLVFCVGLLGLMIGPNVVLAFQEKELATSTTIAQGSPFLLLGLLLMNLLTTAGEKAIYFSPSEIDFLFTAPFSRRELLAYKMVGLFAANAFLALFIAVVSMSVFPIFMFAYLGLFLTFTFVLLTGMVITLCGQRIAQAAFNRTRKLIALGLLFGLGLGMIQAFGEMPSMDDPGAWMDQIRANPVAKIILMPMEFFTTAVFSLTFAQFWPNALAASMIVLGLIATIFLIDANYLEAATNVSRIQQEKIKNFHRTGGLAVKASGPAKNWVIPMLPFWYGAGPQIWRQLLTAFRTSRSMTLIAGLLVGSISIPLLLKGGKVFDSPEKTMGIVTGILTYLTVIFSLNLPMGFRADVDKIEVFKSLPVASWAIALGQLSGPVLVVTCFQWLTIVMMMIATSTYTPMWLLVATVFPLLNIIIFSIANTLFLFYPVQIKSGSRGVQAMGQTMLFMAVQGLVMMVALGTCFGLGALAFWLTKSVVIVSIGVAVVLVGTGILGVLMTSVALNKFDVSSAKF